MRYVSSCHTISSRFHNNIEMANFNLFPAPNKLDDCIVQTGSAYRLYFPVKEKIDFEILLLFSTLTSVSAVLRAKCAASEMCVFVCVVYFGLQHEDLLILVTPSKNRLWMLAVKPSANPPFSLRRRKYWKSRLSYPLCLSDTLHSLFSHSISLSLSLSPNL